MYKACLFDLDGTLLDTVESIAHVANQVLTHYGLDSVPVELFNYFAGDGADELIRRCFVKTGGDLSYLDEAKTDVPGFICKRPSLSCEGV